MAKQDSLTLMDLDDDSLDLILHLFKLDELLSIYNEINYRFNEAIERQFYRFRHFAMEMRKLVGPKHDASKLQALGRHLLSLHISVGYSTMENDVIPLLQPLCQGAAKTQKLRALKLDHTSFTLKFVQAIQLVAPFLLILDMSNCDVRDHMIVRMLENAKNLQHLVFLNIYQLTGEKHLQTLILNQLPNLKLICIMCIGNLPYQLEKFSIKFPRISFLIYDTPACISYKVYGPPVDLDRKHKWNHEYFKTA